MTEKNYDPDNDHCPEKDTVENLHQSKGKNNTTKTFAALTDDDSNHLSSDKVKDLKQKSHTKK